MGRSKERAEVAQKALAAFREVLGIENPGSIERDAAIKRYRRGISQERHPVPQGNRLANLTVHTYNEKLAVEIFGRLGRHESLLAVLLARLARKIG
jgi:hypothetical protein